MRHGGHLLPISPLEQRGQLPGALDRNVLHPHPNHASRYHLNNVKTASLLHHAVRQSATPPGAVMLGHLSEERNRRALAINEAARMSIG
jgi:hypothetical protein